MRRPPAFQVYASDDLASPDYYHLSLAERGLIDAMRRVCWVDRDGAIPRDPDAIAIAIRRPAAEVRLALTAQVLRWFAPGADASCLVEPDLQAQRERNRVHRERMSAGAAQTNAKRWGNGGKPSLGESVSESGSESQGVSPLKRHETKRNPSIGEANPLSTEQTAFVRDYERASNGS